MDNVLDIPAISAVIKAEQPDICALNEVRMRTRDVGGLELARVLGEDNGMLWRFGRAIDYNGGEYGNAILSRWPISSSRVVPVPDVPPEKRRGHFEPRSALECIVETPRGPIRVVTCHFGLSPEEQAEAAQTVASMVGDDLPTAFMGDLNVTPSDPALAPIRALLQDTAGETPLTFSAREPSAKIDYIFLSRHFTAGPLVARQTLASDHLPIAVEAALA